MVVPACFFLRSKFNKFKLVSLEVLFPLLLRFHLKRYIILMQELMDVVFLFCFWQIVEEGLAGDGWYGTQVPMVESRRKCVTRQCR